VTLVACGSSPKPRPTPPAPTATAGIVELAELTFYEGDEAGLKVHADGRIETKFTRSVSGQPPETGWRNVAVLASDGTLTVKGTVAARIKSDGTAASATGTMLPFNLDGDALVVDSKRVTIDEKGAVQGANPMARSLRVEGASTPGLRRTALIVLAVAMGGLQKPGEPAVEVEPKE
jgi:hypothetical protein